MKRRPGKVWMLIAGYFVTVNAVFWTWFGVVKLAIWMIRKYSG